MINTKKKGSLTYHADQNRWRGRVICKKKEYVVYSKDKNEAESKLEKLIENIELELGITIPGKRRTCDATRTKLSNKVKEERRKKEKARSRRVTRYRKGLKRAGCPKYLEQETKKKIKELQETADLEPGTYHIDHIVPLKGKAGLVHVVCGLHVPSNLQLLPVEENLSKCCYTWSDMWDYNEREKQELKRIQALYENQKH